MAAKHIQIAQTDGPKAGFNAYVDTLERSGLDTTKAALAELRSKGNKKAQFEFYCAKFGNKFGATPTKVDEGEDLAAQVQVLMARLSELQAQGIGVLTTDDEDEDTSLDDVDDGFPATPAKQGIVARVTGRASRSSNASTSNNGVSDKENLWRPWAVQRFGIPKKVGGTFTYHSKRANQNTVHQVTRVTEDGVYCKRIK